MTLVDKVTMITLYPIALLIALLYHAGDLAPHAREKKYMANKAQLLQKKSPGIDQVSRPLSKAEAYRLFQTLLQLKKLVSEPKYLYTLVLARRVLQPLAEAVEEMVKPSVRVQEFEQRRQLLCKECAQKDAGGQPQISPEQHFIIAPQQRIAFDQRLLELQKDYEADLAAHQIASSKITAFLAEPADIGSLPQIPISVLAGEVTLDQIDALFPLLIEDSQ
jgi:hypothetical protein